MATHLVQKRGESTWYVRLAIPADVRHAFGGRVKLIRTTGTSNRAEAMDRRLPILAEWKSAIVAARAGKAAIREVWRQEVVDKGVAFRQHVDATIVEAIRNPPRPHPGPFVADEAYGRLVAHETKKLEFLASLQEWEDAGATGIVERARHYLELSETSESTITDAVMRASAFVQDASLQLAEKRYGLSPAELEEAQILRQDPSTYRPVSPITTTRLAAFRAYREKAQIAAKTIDQQESKLKKLSGYLRDEGKTLTSETVGAWLESLGLSSKTKAQYLLAGSTFWAWALKNDARWKGDYAGVENPFKGQELPKIRGKAKAEAARRAFTVDQIEQVFERAQTEGQQTLCDLIQLGAMTGCRIEEICQLRTDSIVLIEGVPSFKIEDSKTAAGIREVPVHSALLPLVERLSKESADSFLIPSSGGNKYGIRSDSLSKAFGRLKTSLGFGAQHVFHSVRSMVITQLLREGIPGVVVANIAGHETGLVTFDVYNEGASPKQKLEALQKLSYNFN